MRVLHYDPVSSTRYITLEDLKDENLGVCVCDWNLRGTVYQRFLQGGSPKTRSYGYDVLGKAYSYYREYLRRVTLPIKYEMEKLPELGLLQVTGVAHHP